MKIQKMFVMLSLCICVPTSGSEEYANGARDIHLYFLAQYNTAGGSQGQACHYYEQLMNKPDVPLAAYKGYVEFLSLNNKYQQIIDLMPKLDASFSDDPAVQMAIMEALDQTHKHDQAVERLMSLAHKNQTSQEIALKAAQVYLAQQEPENAIRIIDTFLENAPQKPNLFMFYFFKAQILIQLDKKQEALAAVKQCLKTHTHFDKGWLLCALLEEQLGNLEGAIKGYSTFLDLVGQDKGIQQHLMQLMFRQKMLAEKTNTLNVSLPCLEKAMLLFEQKKPKAALEQVEECLKKTPKDKDARLLKIQLLGALNQQGIALACLTDWINEDPSKELWYKTLLLMTNHGIMYSDAIHALQLVQKNHPKEQFPVQYIADLYLRSGQQQQAQQALTSLISMSKDPLLCSKAYYQIAVIHYEQRQFDAMVNAATRGLQQKPDFAPLCNLMAYYYAGKGHDSAQAQKLIAIALKADPDNPHYKDTQSHLYYKIHEYTKAVEIIESIANFAKEDIHIAKHAQKIKLKVAKAA
jgi:tetratricopeptide (TPR) repeat protein